MVLDPDLGDHVCLPYGNERERLDATRTLAANGLRRRVKVMIITHTDTPEATRAWLGFTEAEAAGRLEILAGGDTHFVDGRLDPARVLGALAAAGEQARKQGYAGLYLLVDASWGLRDAAGHARLEAATNALCAEGWLAVVCQYDRTLFCGADLDRAACVHPISPDQAMLRFAGTCRPAGLRISGEIDLTNRDAFASILATLESEAAQVVIDATGLDYMDAGAAQLLAATASARGARGTVITCQEPIARLLHLVRADEVITVRDHD
ncbi:MEDS domain-containing protein [Nonomuraea sediminis]|uniref:MEDS domain-containing protein n=1 Tax=Nonomuraea sediminis TaxID=2835864 RepID=UPI001BDBF322|nr:MEDS domain-containing protein [Nonomuraea sediminis]